MKRSREARGSASRLLLVASLGIAIGLVLPLWLLMPVREEPPASGVVDRAVPVLAEDSSGQENHGVIAGRPILGLPGHFGSSYSFDPPGSWVQVASSPSVNPGKADFLISAWVLLDKRPEGDESYDVIRKGSADTQTGEFKLEIVHPGYVRCTAKDSGRRSARVENRAVDLDDGAWHRLGCARTGDTWSALVDGEVTSDRIALGAIGNTLPLAIGSKYGIDDPHQGRLDHVMMTVAPASDASGDVAGAFQRLESAPPSGLWRLDERMTDTRGSD